MEISRQHLESDITVVRLVGRLDAKASPDVRNTLQELIKAGHAKLIVDLENVPFIDSSGLAALVSGLRMAREDGGNVVLSGAQSQAQVVFRLTMLDRVFAIHPSLNEAKQTLI